jgi:hypothetical protein
MGGKKTKTNQGQQRVREWQAWKLKGMGYTDQQIGDQMGVDPSTATRMLQRVRARVEGELREEALRIKLELTEQLKYAASEALAAWRTSQIPIKEVSSTKRQVAGTTATGAPGQIPAGQVDTIRTADRALGNVAYLEAHGKVVDRLDRLWGLADTQPAAPNILVQAGGPLMLHAPFADINLAALEPAQQQAHLAGLIEAAKLISDGALSTTYIDLPPTVLTGNEETDAVIGHDDSAAGDSAADD